MYKYVVPSTEHHKTIIAVANLWMGDPSWEVELKLYQGALYTQRESSKNTRKEKKKEMRNYLEFSWENCLCIWKLDKLQTIYQIVAINYWKYSFINFISYIFSIFLWLYLVSAVKNIVISWKLLEWLCHNIVVEYIDHHSLPTS